MIWTDRGTGGGGYCSLEKATDCGPNAAELWLLRADKPKIKKGGGGLVIIIISAHRELSYLFY